MIADFNDTIAGIATAPGEAGIGIIRLSGESSISIADQVFQPKHYCTIREVKNRYMVYGWVEKDGSAIDEALLCIMRNPHSFTAEDVVEIHCHGGSYIIQAILKSVLDLGARLANPGEFTQRAFLNGRIDLTQAEAVNDLVHTKTALGLDLVMNQLKGKLFEKISVLKEKISWILSLVNAGIDFPEEDTVFANIGQIREKIESAGNELARLINSADTGIKIREGYKIVLAGEPNVGKSSILNGLLEDSRSIVTQTPGTTRDTIEESCTIKGIPVSLTDTAGIHKTMNSIEKEGISRAITAIQTADLILWVIDMSRPSFETTLPEDIDISRIPTLIVLNKKDLHGAENIRIPYKWQSYRTATICALDSEDIDSLRKEIFDFVSGRTGQLVEETMLTNLRQKKSAENALGALNRTKESIEKALGEEFLAEDLSHTLSALGEIVGETTPDEMLNRIFSQFCVGK